MKYTTKQQRLVAIAEAWMQAHGATTFQTRVVAAWARTHGLWPVPKRGDPPVVCSVWEKHLARAVEVNDGRNS